MSPLGRQTAGAPLASFPSPPARGWTRGRVSWLKRNWVPAIAGTTTVAVVRAATSPRGSSDDRSDHRTGFGATATVAQRRRRHARTARVAEPDDWNVRLSVADIDADGPFSALPGVVRWFAVVQGAGVELDFREPDARRITRTDPPLRFDGAAAPDVPARRRAHARSQPDAARRRRRDGAGDRSSSVVARRQGVRPVRGRRRRVPRGGAARARSGAHVALVQQLRRRCCASPPTSTPARRSAGGCSGRRGT